jgi:tRNA threonylcarbamoyladenosine biosynthesis protein TsaE
MEAKQEYITHSPEETAAVAADFASQIKPGLVTLEGNLGAGKTCFSAALLKVLGAEGPYQSPTFVLMKEYELPALTTNGIARVYHADAYRVAAPDFVTIGFEEWLYDKAGLTLLEWPERVAELLPEEYTSIVIETVSETTRKITIEHIQKTPTK